MRKLLRLALVAGVIYVLFFRRFTPEGEQPPPPWR